MNQYLNFNLDVLSCPHCAGEYLHHEEVIVYNRLQEDSERGIAVRTNGINVSQKDTMEGNPSGRRNGVTISFRCETCSSRLLLRVQQHKGQTFMDWDYEPWQTLYPND